MFDLDLSKMVLFGIVALLVVGPKELPAALRLAGRMVATLRRVQSDVRKAADTLMADASLDREIASLRDMTQINLALNPATAMRGSLPASEASRAPVEASEAAAEYASPEMRAYLAPLPEPESSPSPNSA